MALAAREKRLPCARCLRRLSRGTEVDKDEMLECVRPVGNTKCLYCAEGRKPCVKVPVASKKKARRLIGLYEAYCANPIARLRAPVLVAAKALDKLMRRADKKAAPSCVLGFGIPLARGDGSSGGSANLTDINNSLRLLTNAVRGLAEVCASAAGVEIGGWPEAIVEEDDEDNDDDKEDEDDDEDDDDNDDNDNDDNDDRHDT